MKSTKTIDLSGRVAVVTGAAGGIGAAIATAMADSGACVVINDVNEARAVQLAELLSEKLGEPRVVAIGGDAGCDEDVNALMHTTLKLWGRVDILVNNVGISRDRALRKMSEEDWDEVLRVNLKSVFLCTRAAAESMAANGGGRVVNIASRALLGWWGQANYAASKGAIVSFTRSLALELARQKITCNTIAPGLIDTALLRSYPQETQDKLRESQPSKTIGIPADVARVVVYLAAKQAAHINGQLLFVDGGKSLFARSAV
jgi:NAD(P)-dependent dehydrogenase (short-subunit alcohol dehydrogenase family)